MFSPYHPKIGSFWPVCLVQPFVIAGKSYGKTMLYAELVSVDFVHQKCKIQYWHDESKTVTGGLVEERIGELPAIAGEIDTSYRGSFSAKEFKKQQTYDEWESVTNEEALAGDFESVTGDGCLVCGKPKAPRAKTCSPKCRKQLSRKKLSHQ
jgi:hypothetical protein